MFGNQEGGHGPSHACPRCGEWFEVESEGHDTWFVSPYDNEGGLSAAIWTEATHDPLCPFDAATLDLFAIEMK